MTIEALDSAYPPSDAQIAAAKAAGYSGWNGYFAGQNILNGWSDGDFRRVLAGGLGTLAFCSGWMDPTAAKVRGASLGIPILADVEGEIRGDGSWLQPWLDVSGGGLYANYWVFPGKRASRFMLAAYPSSGDPLGVAWSTAYGSRPGGGPCGWQWAGSHNEFGVTVDSEWLDVDFYPLHGAAGGQLGDEEMLYVGPFRPLAGSFRAFAAGSVYRDPAAGAMVVEPVNAGANPLVVDGYLYSSSPVQSSDPAGPDYLWWRRTADKAWFPDAILDTSSLAGAPPPAIPATESLKSYFAVAGSVGPSGPDDDSAYATKADLQAVKDAIPTKASGNVTLTLSK